MSTITNKTFVDSSVTASRVNTNNAFWSFMKALGSLRIAVAMFALGTLMLLIGTLAQDEETIVDVKRNYFNSWIAYVDFDVFVPQTMFPHAEKYPGTFAMPGGATIGLVLLINLFAAKLTRFPIFSKGKRFVAGLIVTLIGAALVALVIVGAHMGDGLQGEPPFSYDSIWLSSKLSVFLLTLLSIVWATLWTPKNEVIFWTCISCVVTTVLLSLFLLFTGDAFRIPDPGLRIVWQLTKSLGVGIVLLTGLILLFGSRGGNVLIHLGVGLLMVGQFVFGDAQREERVSLAEGQRTAAAVEIDVVELVVIDRSPEKNNRVVAFDHHLIAKAVRDKKPLSVDGLPFDIQIDKWFENSNVRRRREPIPADAPEHEMKGLIHDWILTEEPKVGGTSDRSNVTSAYVTLLNKSDQTPIGKYAVSQWFSDDQIAMNPLYDTVDVATKKYDIGLIFRRNYKDYTVTLKDVVLEEYTNSAIPKDYSSYITIQDKDGNVLQDGRVWMNSPMRFRGETFYQSSYISKEQSPYGVEQTVLQVVTNAGWLIPYVSCVLVGLGMLVHFAGTFARFAMRYERGVVTPETVIGKPKRSVRDLVLAGAVVLMLGAYFVSLGIPKEPSRESINYRSFGSLPMHYGGRVKPLASAASEFLEILSNKPYALRQVDDGTPLKEGEYPKERRVVAEEWMFAVMMGDEWVFKNPLFRIDATSTTADLNLTRVKSNRYSYNDIVDGLEALAPRIQQIMLSNQKGESLSFEDQKLTEVLSKLSMFRSLYDSYKPLFPKNISTTDVAALREELSKISAQAESLRRNNNPAMFPSLKQEEVVEGEKAPPKRWDPFAVAFFDAIPSMMAKDDSKSTAAILKFFEISGAYSENKKDGARINRLVEEFRDLQIQAYGADELRAAKVVYENDFEHMNVFGNAGALYLVVGLLALLSYAFAPRTLRTVALWMCIATLLFHTYGIVARIYISERPPVVSLYSAAVFIGWGMVLFCIVSELLFPIGVSLIVASISGYLSLLVAYGLDIGDSMPSLRAVLDTQFWLSTHVITVTIGYSATFFAGIFGIVIVVAKLVSVAAGPKNTNPRIVSVRDSIPILYRICYSVVCLGLFFSFIGTVLGGLWGDDSWGRFWGWDPKENGALMIVLWNALLIHARWDKLVGALGFANLAIFGNVITAWSMFGTNQLGIGLHAYGAFEGDVVRNLVLWCAVQLLFIGIGLVIYLFQSSPSAKSSE